MAVGNGIRDEIKEQRQNLKNMTKKEKAAYIWEYYRLPIVGSLLAIIFVVSLVVSIVRNNYDTVCYIAVADGHISDGTKDLDVLTKGMTEYLGVDGKKKRVDFDYTYTLREKELDQDAAISSDKLLTLAYAGDLDGFICEREFVDYFGKDTGDFYCDLNTVFDEEEMEFLKDNLIYCRTEKGQYVPFAVKIKDAPVIKDSDLSLDNPCYGICSTSKYKSNAADFIRYIFKM